MNRNMRYRPNAGSGSLGTYRNLGHNREALQQRGGKPQQKMASNNKPFNRKRQYDNEHLSQNYVPYNTNQSGTQNFAHLYDDGPGPSYDRGYVPNKNRRKINVWDIDVFGANQNAGNQRNMPYVVRQSSPPRPLMDLPGPPPKLRRPPLKTHANFKPKVNKPKRKPQAQPIESSAQDKGQFILRADKVPCQQLVGRIELALGSILKEMKAKLCTDTKSFSLFTTKVIQRSIKQTIRERIKTVMLNKYVGKYVDVIEAYRKRYPQSTDKDFFDMAVLKTGTSEKHLKQSFDKILIKKVNNMFRKLQVLVEEKEMEVAKLIETRQLFKDDKKTEEEIKQAVKIETDFYTSIVDSMLAVRLPKILPNYAMFIVKMLKREGHLDQINGDDANDDGPIELPDSDAEEDVIEVQPDDKENVETLDTEMAEINDTVQDEEMTETNEETEKDVSDEQNENTKNKIDIKVKPETNAEVNKNDVVNIETNDGKLDNVELEKTSKEMNSPSSQTFLVKVLCQPELPSKAEAYKFLNKFNMASVKKHKVIQNLLVVGFNNEKDYNDALAASGTVIENSTLIIKGNKSQTTSASNSMIEIKEEQNSKDALLTPELEDQITDLLSSIRYRKSDANDSMEQDNETTNQDENPKDNNLYSPSNPYDDANDLDAIKEIDETVKSEPKESETTEDDDKSVTETTKEDIDKTTADDVDKKTAEDVDKKTAEVVDKKTAEVVDKTTADVDKNADVDETPADVDKAKAEDVDKTKAEDVDTAAKVKIEAKSTPVRSSTRLAATPSNVRTRRASRLTQNN